MLVFKNGCDTVLKENLKYFVDLSKLQILKVLKLFLRFGNCFI